MTDTRIAPAQLSQDYLRALFTGSRFAVIACDVNGDILAWNEAAGKLFPRLGSDSYGHAAIDLFEGDIATSIDQEAHACVAARAKREFQWQTFTPEHRSVTYGLSWVPVMSDSGELTGISLWFRDITERVKLAKTVERRQRLNVLGSLAGAVAHHYNNLLCSIATSLEYATNLNTPHAIQRALQRTADAVTRAGEINQQLLAFARADHRERTFSDLTEAVLYYFDEHEKEIEARNVKLNLAWEVLPICPVPRDPFNIIVDNLVRNACEAMPDGGSLSVTLTRHDDRHAALSITDTGKGIDPDALEHLFEPFFTTKGVLGRGASSNAGMGLAVVHGFVSEMGGFVTAGNVSQGGARFEVVLPLSDAS